MEIFIYSVIVLGILGFICAGLLGFAADHFFVEEDPRIAKVLAVLPGVNCGVCGSAGCHQFAERVVKGDVEVGGCLPGGQTAAKKIADLLGKEEPMLEKKFAAVHCGARESQRQKRASYAGVKTCAAAIMVGSGGLMCSYGCLGFGDCFDVCPFDAIKMVAGLPLIDLNTCTACGKCVTACPQQIISLIPADFPVVVACSSRDKGAFVRRNCPVGCIGCLICEKEVPTVFKIVDNLAIIDYNQRGIDCGQAAGKCPTKCIINL